MQTKHVVALSAAATLLALTVPTGLSFAASAPDFTQDGFPTVVKTITVSQLRPRRLKPEILRFQFPPEPFHNRSTSAY
ncbi:hypothetical protein [Sulfobacillus thermosulfidooxidans]|uniref:hypothetical protein n=1 Tax=Sulfobacillus thermosulfidooxidans TaxID=28034 RepID=UPI001FA8DC37|nr:hypothetical protein [Sulfobacillus thermosulfidooxidans]